jgi:hypothetical protein
MCFFTQLIRPIWKKMSVSPSKALIGRHYSFQKLTQFSKGNKYIDAPVSNIHGFLSIDICVSASLLNRPIWNKTCISPHWKSWWWQYSFQKLTQLSQGNKVLDASPSNIDVFPLIDTCFYTIQLNRPIWNKISISHFWKPWLTGGIPFKN